jgi:four helix bundle protein
MCAWSHRELQAWKLADAVRRGVLLLCARPDVKQDFEFCDQADRASSSACRNIAEGFARYGHPEFARFVSIARGSLGELQDSADKARLKHYIDDEEWQSLDRVIRGAKAAANGLHGYLKRTPTPTQRPKQRRRRPQPRSGK